MKTIGNRDVLTDVEALTTTQRKHTREHTTEPTALRDETAAPCDFQFRFGTPRPLLPPESLPAPECASSPLARVERHKEISAPTVPLPRMLSHSLNRAAIVGLQPEHVTLQLNSDLAKIFKPLSNHRPTLNDWGIYCVTFPLITAKIALETTVESKFLRLYIEINVMFILSKLHLWL